MDVVFKKDRRNLRMKVQLHPFSPSNEFCNISVSGLSEDVDTLLKRMKNCPDIKYEYRSKVAAIKLLKSFIKENYNGHISLLDAKHLVEDMLKAV